MGLKTINPEHRNPKVLPKYFFRYFHHFIGKGFHGDFRWKQNDHLKGWTIATVFPSSVKESIGTVSEAKRITREVDVKFKPDMEPTKHVLAFIKARQPLEWMEMYNKIIEPGAGPGASKEEAGVFVLIDEGIGYPGTSKPYFQELFLAGKQFKGRMVVRQLETPKEWEKAGGPGEPMNWQIWMTKEQTPYILTPRGREEKTIPPKEESWLPPEWEKKIPEEFQWWKKDGGNKMINEAFNYLVDKGELKHRKIETEEINLKEVKFTLRFRSWMGALIKRGMPNVKYDLLIDSGEKCLAEWIMERNPLATQITGVTIRLGKFCGETPDEKDNSGWLEWEGSIPPAGVKLRKGKIVKRLEETDQYIVKIGDEEIETKESPLSERLLKPNSEVWLDNRKYIYTTNKGQKYNPNKAIPIHFGIIDSGNANWIEDSELFSSFKFYGEKLKGYWIMKREEPKSNLAVFKKSQLPGGDTNMKDFKFVYPLDLKDLKEHSAEIEILREGIWEHPEAPDGILEITKKDLTEFVKNFKDKIVGDELPLDYEHKPEKGHAIGWITNLWTKFRDGIWHLWAKLNVTDEEAQKDLKSGCLKYISPQILISWKNPEDQKLYNVIRSAALTNYPFIKKMEPAIVNFEEIREEVNRMKNEDEIKAMEEELKKKEAELSQKEAKLDEREATLKTGEEEIKQREEKLQDQAGKYPGPFYGLPKTQATDLGNKCLKGDKKACDILIKYATGGIYGYPKAQLQEEGAVEYVTVEKTALDEFKKDIEDLKTSKESMQKALSVTAEEAKTLRQERDEVRATNLIDGLIQEGKVVPAQKDLLKLILLAKDESTIELEEDGKKKEVSKTEALLHFLMSAPAKVELGQRGVSVQTLTDEIKSAKDIVNMTDEDWAKLSPEEREAKLKSLDDTLAKQRKR